MTAFLSTGTLMTPRIFCRLRSGRSEVCLTWGKSGRERQPVYDFDTKKIKMLGRGKLSQQNSIPFSNESGI